MRSRWLAIPVFAVCSLAIRIAHADGEAAAAEALFDEGKKLLEQGKPAEACPKLEASLKLDRGIGTMLFLAECWDQQGRTASAWAQFREAADVAAKAGDQREKVARKRASEIEPKLSKLTIHVAAAQPSSIVVERDGHPVLAAVWGTALPIDPGEHVVKASAPGYKPWSTTIRVAANAAQALVEIPALQTAETAKPEEPKPAPVTTTRTWQRILGLGVAGLGVGAIGVGAAYGLSAIAKNDRADEHCPAVGCDVHGLTLGETADSDAAISTVAFTAGAVLVIGGAVLFFTARTSSPSAAAFARPGLTF